MIASILEWSARNTSSAPESSCHGPAMISCPVVCSLPRGATCGVRIFCRLRAAPGFAGRRSAEAYAGEQAEAYRTFAEEPTRPELEQFFLHVGGSTYSARVIEIGSRARTVPAPPSAVRPAPEPCPTWFATSIFSAARAGDRMAPRSNAGHQKADTWVTHFACNATAAQTQYLL
jgi:hypothetical protein